MSAPEVLSGYDAFIADIIIIFMFAGFSLLGLFFLHSKNMPRLALCLLMPVFFVIGGLAAYRTQYIVFHIGRELGLIDSSLASLDNMLGFNWTGYFTWVVGHPITNVILEIAYKSIWVQPLFLSAAFILFSRFENFGRLQISLPLSFALVVMIATILPALGAYQFHNMTLDHHPGVRLEFTDGMTAPIKWLRQAQLPPTLPNFADFRVITFPSWHASAAVIFTLSFWAVPFGRWPGVLLNLLMLAATPVHGSHYLTDMIVGAGLGGTAFALAAWLLAPRAAPWASASLSDAEAFVPNIKGPARQIGA